MSRPDGGCREQGGHVLPMTGATMNLFSALTLALLPLVSLQKGPGADRTYASG